MPKVSVIVPVYNGMPYIQECLQSIVNQTLDDIEIIIINDGSNDGTKEVLDKYKENYKNIILVNQENQGLYVSRKKGLELATGEYVGWVDADDFIDLKMYEILYSVAKEKNSELVYCDYKWIPNAIKTKAKWFREYKGKRDVDFVERNSQPWNKIVKRDLLIRLNIGNLFITCFDEAYIKVLINAKNPISINEKLYSYRVGSASMSSAYTNVKHYEKFVNASERLKEEMVSEDNYWNEYFQYRVIYYLLLSMLVSANANDKLAYKKIKIRFRELKVKNAHLISILNKNYGIIKSFAIRRCVPFNFCMARVMSILAFSIIK